MKTLTRRTALAAVPVLAAMPAVAALTTQPAQADTLIGSEKQPQFKQFLCADDAIVMVFPVNRFIRHGIYLVCRDGAPVLAEFTDYKHRFHQTISHMDIPVEGTHRVVTLPTPGTKEPEITHAAFSEIVMGLVVAVIDPLADDYRELVNEALVARPIPVRSAAERGARS